MIIKPLKLEGTFEITLQPRMDERGYFTRAYDREVFAGAGLVTDWVQENQSLTARRNTIRGLHFQLPPFTETKLVRAVSGSVLDVFVDLRKKSPSYGKWDSVELGAEKLNYVYIPKGFAHGFRTLSENSVIQYKVDAVYSRMHDCGIRWNDSEIRIDWGEGNFITSEKDSIAQLFSEFESPF
ncbi:MAG: dTDP-4-dehydrorhamnose 3,5-epimerase [Pyrinomonadaceae bacterium]